MYPSNTYLGNWSPRERLGACESTVACDTWTWDRIHNMPFCCRQPDSRPGPCNHFRELETETERERERERERELQDKCAFGVGRGVDVRLGGLGFTDVVCSRLHPELLFLVLLACPVWCFETRQIIPWSLVGCCYTTQLERKV